MKRFQMTLDKEVVFEGAGVHSGENSRVVCFPESDNHGLLFSRVDVDEKPEWRIKSDNFISNESDATKRQSILYSDSGSIGTPEHFLAALWVMGISNLRIEVHGSEFPILDGSSADFVRAFNAAGLKKQSSEIESFSVKEPIFCFENNSSILILPNDELRITYTLDYKGIPRQIFSSKIDRDIFEKDLASARTFCTKEESEFLLKNGFGKGATHKNTLVINGDGPVNNEYRFFDECSRHKVLDLIGDLSLLGFDLRAHIIGIRSGHSLNHKVREAIYKQRNKFYDRVG